MVMLMVHESCDTSVKETAPTSVGAGKARSTHPRTSSVIHDASAAVHAGALMSGARLAAAPSDVVITVPGGAAHASSGAAGAATGAAARAAMSAAASAAP